MKFTDIFRESFTNIKRNKSRSFLTIIAVWVGAFALALSSSLGTGVSTYIASQLGQIGNDGMMSVSKPDPNAEKRDTSKPPPYKETNASSTETQIAEATAGMGFSVGMLNDEDLEKIATVDNIERVEATIISQPKYIQGSNDEKWLVTPNIASSVMNPDLTAGAPFSENGNNNEIIIPQSYIEALGYSNDKESIGETVTLVVDNVLKEEETVEATIVGVNNKSLFGETVSLNKAVSESLIEAQKVGLPEGMEIENSYISAILHIEQNLTPEQIQDIKDDLSAKGYDAQTISDQIGVIQAVVDGFKGILNGIAIIVLIVAGFGIVNTLLMSVQDRTREIGLMKAMGLSSSKIYTLFSTEAVGIGLIGTLIGIGTAMITGVAINTVLADTLLADLPGLTLSLFTFPDILTVIITVMAISLLAGTIPSMKAAKQNPIDALRYE